MVRTLQAAKNWQKKVVPKSDDAVERITAAINGNVLFSHLNKAERADLVDCEPALRSFIPAGADSCLGGLAVTSLLHPFSGSDTPDVASVFLSCLHRLSGVLRICVRIKKV